MDEGFPLFSPERLIEVVSFPGIAAASKAVASTPIPDPPLFLKEVEKFLFDRFPV